MKANDVAVMCAELRGMSLDNWSGSDADRKRICAAASEMLAQFQFAGWAEPGQAVSEVHDDLSEFVLSHHSGCGDPVLEVMPVWVSRPMWTNSYVVGDEGDQWEEVDLHDTKEQADAADAKYLAEVASQEPV